MDLEDLLSPPIEQLVEEIFAVNCAWKEACSILGEACSLATSLRDLKNRLQVRLLRCYAPTDVVLEMDTATESKEPLYGLRLLKPIGLRLDAAHLPVRVAQDVLTPDEIRQFSRT